VRKYNGSRNDVDAGMDVTVDDSGNVYVTGFTDEHADGGPFADYLTIKYYPNGDTAWVRIYDGENEWDNARAIAVGGSGNVYVTGTSCVSQTGNIGDYATIKYYPDGDTAWVRRYNGPANEWDEAHAIAIDKSGNVYVTGQSSGTFSDYATIKYYPNGDTAWVRRYNGTGNSEDIATDLAIDSCGNTYVAGGSWNGTDFDYAIVKYDSSGNQLWVKTYNGPTNGDDGAQAIAVCGCDTVYVTGESEGGGTGTDYATIKFIKAARILPNAQQRVHRTSDVQMCMTNWGAMGSRMRDLSESKGGCFNPHPEEELPAPSFEYPSGSGIEYLYQGGIWIGAKIGDSVYTTVGYDGGLWVYELWPDGPAPLVDILERSTKPTASCYSPDAVSHQDLIAVYTDTSADIPLSPWKPEDCDWDQRKHHPLDVRVTQKSYSWDTEGYDKFIIAEYTIENIGSYLLSEAYIGFFMDSDIMHIDESIPGLFGYVDDITGFLHVYAGDTVNIAWIADNDGHGVEGEMTWTSVSPRSVIGMKVLLTPNPDLEVSYNWWVSAPSNWGPWIAANQNIWQSMNPYGSGNLFPDNVLGTPGGDVSKYFLMSNGEVDYDQIYSCVWPDDHPEDGWLPPNPECVDIANGCDTRFLISFGPFDQIAPGDSLTFAVAYVIGESLHVDPLNLVNDPDMSDPDAYYAKLYFADLVYNALKAESLYLYGVSTDVRDETGSRERPSEFSLSQNYPNPFNQATEIKFTLTRSDFVSLNIYNLLGRKVRTLVSENLSSGYKSVRWDGKNDSGKNVASGIYFYQLRVGDFTETKKLVLLK
jgi:hypothetical protein